MKRLTILIIALLIGFAGHTQFVWVNNYAVPDASALHAVAFLNAHDGVAVGAAGTLILTDDGGDNWVTIKTGYDVNFNGVAYHAKDTIVIVGDEGVLLRTTDGGDNWDDVDHPAGDVYLYDVDIDAASGNGIIAGEGNLIMWTYDAGETWLYVNGGQMNTYNSAFMANSDFGMTIGENALFQPYAGFTKNGGESWNAGSILPVIGGSAMDATGYDSYFFNEDDGFVIGSTFNGLGFLTTEVDWGNTRWEAMAFDSPIYAIDFSNDNLGAVAGFQGYLAETTNGGETWEQATIEDSKTISWFNDITMYGTTGFAVTQTGVVYKRTLPMNTQQPPNPVKEFMLYPNPAERGFTNIHLNIDKSIDVTVSVKDLTGREVSGVEQGNLAAGSQQFKLNTGDLNSGVYIVEVNTGGYRMTKKLIIP